MGKPQPPPAPYRDDPDAVSLHTTPDDYQYDDAPEISDSLPPSYADSQGSSSAATPAPAPTHHAAPLIERSNHSNHYTLKLGKPQVPETKDLRDPRYDTDPAYLEEAVRKLADEGPYPLVYILGTHKETVRSGDKKETKDIVDFRLVMSLRQYLTRSNMNLETVENSEKTYRGSVFKCRAPGYKQDIEVGDTRPGLKEWCHRYCASPRMLKVFRLSHVVCVFNHMTSNLTDFTRQTDIRLRRRIPKKAHRRPHSQHQLPRPHQRDLPHRKQAHRPLHLQPHQRMASNHLDPLDLLPHLPLDLHLARALLRHKVLGRSSRRMDMVYHR